MENLKLTIKANNGINNVNIVKNKENIDYIEIDFNTCPIFSDLEIWLNTIDDKKFLDYIKLCISKTKKLQAYKK